MILRSLAFILLCLPAFGAYTSKRSITIDHTQAGGTNTSNFVFPFRTTSTNLNGAINNSQTSITVFSGAAIATGDSILIQTERMLVTAGGGTTGLTVTRGTGGTSAASHADKLKVTNIFLATVANGGTVQNSSGYDVTFSSDNACATGLNFELEDYNVTGDATWHVQLSSLSHTVDTVVYVCYNNSSISTFQGNVSGTWDSNYKRVYHLSTGSNTLDSTGNQNLNTSGTSLNLGSLADGGTRSTTQTGGTANGIPYGSSTRTLEVWLNSNSCSTSENILVYGANTALNFQDLVLVCGSGSISYEFGVFGGSNHVISTGGAWGFLADPDWNYFVASYDGTKAYLYVDGVLQNAGGTTFALNTTSSIAFTINFDPTGFQHDEVRLSDVNRSADYMTATWNAYKVSSTFFTLGAGTAVSTGRVRHRVTMR